jgi:hypothetical protein
LLNFSAKIFLKIITLAPRLPNTPEAISCNWKNLLKTLESGKPAKKAGTRPKFVAATAKVAAPAKRPPASQALERKKPEIWFDDVDECLLDPEDRPGLSPEKTEPVTAEKALVKEKAFKG